MNDFDANRPDFMLANRLKTVFVDDPDVECEYVIGKHGENSKIIINVRNSRKASAIRKIVPKRYDEEKTAYPLDVEVNDTSGIDKETTFDAFTGNPHFKDFIDVINPLMQEPFHVCIFNREVIQFKNDNGGSLHGFEFRLMEDLARETLDIPMIFFTTDDGLPYERNDTEGEEQ